MMRMLKSILALAAVAVIVGQVATEQRAAIELRNQGLPLLSNSESAQVLVRACGNCHSNRTDWPWYSHVAPVSWLVIEDVNDARRIMNFSEWGRLDVDRQRKKLQQMCDEVTDGAMPLGSYTPLHPGSKLTADDVKTLCDWTNDERQRLDSSSAK